MRASILHILKWKLARRTFYINVALKCAFCHNREREGESYRVSGMENTQKNAEICAGQIKAACGACFLTISINNILFIFPCFAQQKQLHWLGRSVCVCACVCAAC